MSRFLKEKYRRLTPYTPGEQPRERNYVKLNTNESPFGEMNRYPDPECTLLRRKLAERYAVKAENIVCANGSDEALFLIFDAFFEEVAFPDVTYGFYRVFCERLGIGRRIIPLTADYAVDPADYRGLDCGIVIANPNAQTGQALSLTEVEDIVAANADSPVVIDEAYVDFGAESAVPLIEKYDNLLVVMTFSKSRSLAGARLGFAMGDAALIGDINTLRYSMNPYNVNAAAQELGAEILDRDGEYMANCRRIAEIRDKVCAGLDDMGFEHIPSRANFLLISRGDLTGERIYTGLRERGVLVRYFDEPRLRDHVRVTIGTEEQMEIFLEKLEEII